MSSTLPIFDSAAQRLAAKRAASRSLQAAAAPCKDQSLAAKGLVPYVRRITMARSQMPRRRHHMRTKSQGLIWICALIAATAAVPAVSLFEPASETDQADVAAQAVMPRYDKSGALLL